MFDKVMEWPSPMPFPAMGPVPKWTPPWPPSFFFLSYWWCMKWVSSNSVGVPHCAARRLGRHSIPRLHVARYVPWRIPGKWCHEVAGSAPVAGVGVFTRHTRKRSKTMICHDFPIGSNEEELGISSGKTNYWKVLPVPDQKCSLRSDR